jgi:hypothetical protein
VVGTIRVSAVTRAIARMGIVAVTLAGFASAPPNSLAHTTAPPARLVQVTTPASRLDKILVNEGVAPGSVSPGMVRPNGTLNNGLLPEQWGETS